MEYTVSFTAAGDGAKVAIQDLKVIQQAATVAASSLNKLGGVPKQTLDNLTRTSTATSTAIQQLGVAVRTVAGSTIPQLGGAMNLASAAMRGVELNAVSMGGKIGLAGAAIAGLAATAYSGVQALSALESHGLSKTSAVSRAQQVEEQAATLQRELATMREAGAITEDTFVKLNRALSGSIGKPQNIAWLEWWGNLVSKPFGKFGGFITDLTSVPSTEELARFVQETNSFAQSVQGAREAIRKVQSGTAQEAIQNLQILSANKMAQSDQAAAGFDLDAAADRARRLTLLREQYNDSIKLTNQLENEGKITAQDATNLRLQADTALIRSQLQLRKEMSQTQQLIKQTGEVFATQLSSSIVSAFQNGKFAMKDFASQFFATVAQMILQAAILRALFGATGAGGLLGGMLAQGGVAFAARGGTFPRFAANGLAGVQSVSSPTYFPRFNVVAGEAGREMLTVLAKPRFMEVGGIQSVVGNAGPNRLAISNADELAARGGNGIVDIRVTLGPELRAEIVNQSVQNAVVTVTQEAQSNTPLRRAIRQGQA